MLQIHYIRVSFARSALFLVVGLALVALVACSSGGEGDGDGSSSSGGGSSPANSSSGGNVPGVSSSSDGGNPTISSSSDGNAPSVSSSSGGGTSSGGSSSPSSNVDVENAIKIEFKNGSAPVITNTFSEVTITPTGENVVIRIPNAPDDKEPKYNFVISGTASNGTVKFYGDARKSLYLNGVNITNSKGPAINIQGGKRVNVHLVDKTQNFLTDGPNYDTPPSGEQAKGTFFSEGKLEFESNGAGSLEVNGKYKHAIVVDNGFELKSGKIVVKESVNDGIHANDKIEVKGGELDITSKGDAIQNERNDSIKIWGGKIKAQTTGIKSHGIASDSGAVSIGGNAIIDINVSGNGSKGIKARNWMEFIGNAKTTITTSGTKYVDPGDSDDESNATGIKLTKDLFIEGGELTIKSLGIGAKGINTDANGTIKNSKVNIESDDNCIKANGTLTIESGTVTLKSKTTKAINAKVYDKKGGTVNIEEK